MSKASSLSMSTKQWIESGLLRSCQYLPEVSPESYYWFTDLTISTLSDAGEDCVTGTGEGTMNFRRRKDEEILMPKKVRWSIKVLKSKDNYGIPVAVAKELKVQEKK